MEVTASKEILGAVKVLSGKFDTLSKDWKTHAKKTEERFDAIDERFNEMQESIHVFSESADRRFDRIEADVGSLKQRVTSIETNMVTKRYLDDKFADFKGDIVAYVGREDAKILAKLS